MNVGWVDLGAIVMIVAIVWWFWGGRKSQSSGMSHH